MGSRRKHSIRSAPRSSRRRPMKPSSSPRPAMPTPSMPRACRSPRPSSMPWKTARSSRKAATARGIPVTNIPDTFIEEVADHAIMLLLAGFRRLVAQDKIVREGRWSEGRPALLKIPRLMGQTLGFISFGRVARAVVRVADDGLRSVYPGDADFRARRDTGDPVGGAVAIGFRIDARAGAPRGPSHARRKALQANEAERRFHQYRARCDGGRGSADQGAAGGLDRACRA